MFLVLWNLFGTEVTITIAIYQSQSITERVIMNYGFGFVESADFTGCVIKTIVQF